MDKEEFHKQYDLFNLSIILETEIYSEYMLNHYKISIKVSIKNGIGTIRVCNFRNLALHEIIQDIKDHLNKIGLTDFKVSEFGNSIETDAENIHNLVTIYRMKGLLPC